MKIGAVTVTIQAEHSWGNGLWEKLLNTHIPTTNIFASPLIGQLRHYSQCGKQVFTKRFGLVLCFCLKQVLFFFYWLLEVECMCAQALACLCPVMQLYPLSLFKAAKGPWAHQGCKGVREVCLPSGQTWPCLSSAFFWGEILSPSKARNRKYHEVEEEERWVSPKADRWKIKRRVELLCKARLCFHCRTGKQIPLNPLWCQRIGGNGGSSFSQLIQTQRAQPGQDTRHKLALEQGGWSRRNSNVGRQCNDFVNSRGGNRHLPPNTIQYRYLGSPYHLYGNL